MGNFSDLPLELQRQIIASCVDINLLTYKKVPLTSLGDDANGVGLGISVVYMPGPRGDQGVIETKKLASVASVSKMFLEELKRTLEDAVWPLPELHHELKGTHDLLYKLRLWQLKWVDIREMLLSMLTTPRIRSNEHQKFHRNLQATLRKYLEKNWTD